MSQVAGTLLWRYVFTGKLQTDDVNQFSLITQILTSGIYSKCPKILHFFFHTILALISLLGSCFLKSLVEWEKV